MEIQGKAEVQIVRVLTGYTRHFTAAQAHQGEAAMPRSMSQERTEAYLANQRRRSHPAALPRAKARPQTNRYATKGHDQATSTSKKQLPRQCSHPTAKFEQSFLDSHTAVVTCGLLYFEDAAYSSHKSKEWLNNHRSWKVKHGLLTFGHENYDEESYTRFMRSFRSNYPKLCEGRNMIVIDCTVITNTEHDKNLRCHLGTHPDFQHSHGGRTKLSTTGKNLVIIVIHNTPPSLSLDNTMHLT